MSKRSKKETLASLCPSKETLAQMIGRREEAIARLARKRSQHTATPVDESLEQWHRKRKKALEWSLRHYAAIDDTFGRAVRHLMERESS